MKILTVTGYKTYEMGIFSDNDERIKYIKEALRRRIIQFIEEGLEWVLISGQLGVELWTGEIILQLQEEDYEIHLGIIPPFTNQSERWSEEVQLKYDEICSLADFYRPLYNKDYTGPHQFQTKNEWLLQKSDGCLILVDEENQGSIKFFYDAAVSFAKHNPYEIHFVTPFDLDDVVSDMTMFDEFK